MKSIKSSLLSWGRLSGMASSLFLLSASVSLLSSCSSEKEEASSSSLQPSYRIETVRLGFEGKSSADGQVQSGVQSVSSLAEDSKVSFSEDKGSFSWQGGEKVRVQLSGGTAVDGTVGAAGSSSTMTVTVPSGQSRTGFAYYPATIVSTTASSRSLTVTLPDTYDSYAYPYAPTPMIAEQTTESGVSVLDNLRFLHLGGVALLELKVASDVTANVTSIKVTADKRITGDFTATGSFGGYAISTDGASSGTSVTYNLATPVSPGGTQKLFLPLPVGSYTISKVQAFSSEGSRVALSSASTSSFNITRKGGSKFTDSKAIALAKVTTQEYSVYEIVYGTGNCIVDSGTGSNRSIIFDATPYESTGGEGEKKYLYTSKEAFPEEDKVPVTAKVLWYESLSAVPSASLNADTNQVTVSGISGKGNCVVGLYNSSNEIIWSFHIWSPGWDPTSANTRNYNGYTVMGASLGAMNAYTDGSSATLANACGMYYQWGRKDPLGRSNGTGALTSMTAVNGSVPSTASAGLIAVDDASTFSNPASASEHIAYTIKNPHMYITSGVSNSYNWLTNATYTSTASDTWDNYLWGTLHPDSSTYTEIGKTIFDPCPAGWKVSTTGKVFDNCTTSDVANKGRNVTKVNGTSMKDFIAYSGDRYDSGALYNVSGNGSYWSSCQYSSSRIQGQYFQVYSQSLNPTNDIPRAYGLTVRCVRLQN